MEQQTYFFVVEQQTSFFVVEQKSSYWNNKDIFGTRIVSLVEEKVHFIRTTRILFVLKQMRSFYLNKKHLFCMGTKIIILLEEGTVLMEQKISFYQNNMVIETTRVVFVVEQKRSFYRNNKDPFVLEEKGSFYWNNRDLCVIERKVLFYFIYLSEVPRSLI